ncbi:MAG: glucose-1-phosphate thymidylyltransferase RfbA [Legionellales bacterium]|nr:glucose-1-phosphate thymidylyltransferase RfbA [Legionellales bacterium]
MVKKGIILAGGSGTRLYPLTKTVSKQLLPVYNKPMIYFPVSILMMLGIKDILILSNPEHIELYNNLLGSGSEIGINFQYRSQPSAGGLPEAFILGEDFIGDDNVAMILGDNIFYGTNLFNLLRKNISKINTGATIFACKVKEPKRFGVIEFDKNYKVLSIEEKPDKPKSNYAVTGLYFYDKNVVSYSKSLSRSSRGELEITDLNNIYLKDNNLNVELLGRGDAWLDAGTHDSLLEAGEFVRTLEHRQGLQIACLEEIAYLNNFISKEQLLNIIDTLNNSNHKQYLLNLAHEK